MSNFFTGEQVFGGLLKRDNIAVTGPFVFHEIAGFRRFSDGVGFEVVCK